MNGRVSPWEWYQAFRREVRAPRWADPLREAARAVRLRAWTEHLTDAVVSTCRSLGWDAVARRYPGAVLPVSKQEYLGMDVMAFPPGDKPGWRRPVAAFELENRLDLNAVAYSVWKVSMVRCLLGGVFCYRRELDEIGDLLRELAQGVLSEVFPAGEVSEPKVMLVVGTQSRAEDFPDGFFKPYLWDGMTGQFQRLW